MREADRIYAGAKIYTLEKGLPVAEAVACRDGIILAAGSREEIFSLAGKDCLLTEFHEGQFMLPGFIDAARCLSYELFSELFPEVDFSEDGEMPEPDHRELAEAFQHAAAAAAANGITTLADRRATGWMNQLLSEALAYYPDCAQFPRVRLLGSSLPPAKAGSPEAKPLTGLESAQEAVEFLTVLGAKALGYEAHLGSISPGKKADFAVFSRDPFTLAPAEFPSLYADITILDGDISFDWEENRLKSEYDLMMGQMI